MSSLQYWVLDVGQGSGNFLQVYDDTGHLVGSILMDFGSRRAKAAAGGPSAATIATLLGTDATLDLVVLSHSDVDHINLIRDLLRRYNRPSGRRPRLSVQRVVYSGKYSQYKKGNTNVIDLLKTYMPKPATAKSIPPCFSVFFKDETPDPNFTLGDLRLYVLMANAAEARGKKRRLNLSDARGGKRKREPDGYNVNTNSVVVIVEQLGAQYLITGDATGLTLLQINKVLTAKVKQAYLDAVVMLTLPHHGSATSAFDVQGVDAEQNVTTFANNIAPCSVTGSADKFPKYNHPSSRLIEFFWEHVNWDGGPYWSDDYGLDGRHFYTAYFDPGYGYKYKDGGKNHPWPAEASWYSVQTEYDIYTNIYVDRPGGQEPIVLPPDGSGRQKPNRPRPPRPFGVAWVYTLRPDGVELNISPNRADYLRMVAGRDVLPAGWPDPATLGDAPHVLLPSAARPAGGPPPGPASPAAGGAMASPPPAPSLPAPAPRVPALPAPAPPRLPRLRALP